MDGARQPSWAGPPAPPPSWPNGCPAAERRTRDAGSEMCGVRGGERRIAADRAGAGRHAVTRGRSSDGPPFVAERGWRGPSRATWRRLYAPHPGGGRGGRTPGRGRLAETLPRRTERPLLVSQLDASIQLEQPWPRTNSATAPRLGRPGREEAAHGGDSVAVRIDGLQLGTRVGHWDGASTRLGARRRRTLAFPSTSATA